MRHKPTDRTGKTIKVGDLVRIVGVPELAGMAPGCAAESQPVFEYLVGKYKRVQEFDDYGLVWLRFTIREGPLRGYHAVGIEPHHLRVRRPRDGI